MEEFAEKWVSVVSKVQNMYLDYNQKIWENKIKVALKKDIFLESRY